MKEGLSRNNDNFWGHAHDPSLEKLNSHDERVLKDLDTYVGRLIEQLREGIETGKYGVIIGDDASGRIPALMVQRIIKGIYREKGLPHGDPLLKFFAGSTKITDHPNEAQENKFSQLAASMKAIHEELQSKGMPDNALIVTDTIKTGQSIDAFSEALHKNRMSFDVATVGIIAGEDDDEFHKKFVDMERRWGAQIFFGFDGEFEIYQSPLSGVSKDPADLHATKNQIHPMRVAAARKKASEIADIILKRYLRQ